MVASPPARSSRNASAGLHYITGGRAHDGTDKPRSWFTTGLGCNPETADAEWTRVRESAGKNGYRHVVDEYGDRWEGTHVQAVHVVLSFDRSEYDPNDPAAIERAHAQAVDTAARLSSGHQAVIGTQTDGESGLVHAHLYFNAVHPATGLSMSGRHPAKDVQQLREVVNEVSLEYGRDNAQLMASRSKSLKVPAADLSRRKSGEYVWRDDLNDRLTASLAAANDRAEWKAAAADHGVEIRYHGRGISYGFSDDDGEHHRVRARDLGTRWSAKTVDAALTANREMAAATAAERSAPEPPRSAPPSAAAVEAIFGRAPATPTPQPAPPRQSMTARLAATVQHPAPALVRTPEVSTQPEPEPYDEWAAMGNHLCDELDPLSVRKTGRKRADGTEESFLDAVHRRAEKRAAETGQTPAEAFAWALDDTGLKSGKSMREFAREKAVAGPVSGRNTLPGETMSGRRERIAATLRQGRAEIAEINSRQRERSRDRGMTM